MYRTDLSYAVPFLKKGITVNHWKSSIVPMRFEKFATIKHLFPNDSWISERNKNNKEEFDDETILHIQGNWEIDNLDLDNIFNQSENPEHIFTILVEGNLKSKNIFNENTDGGTNLIVLGKANVDNLIIGGQEIYISKNLTINECFWGEYNHGDLVVKGETKAKVFIATNEYHYEYERTRIKAEHFLLDFDNDENGLEYDENIIKSIFTPEIIITEEEFDDEVFSWENFLSRDKIIEQLKEKKSIINIEIELKQTEKPSVEIIFKNKIFPIPIERVTFCGKDFKVISRLEADDLIGNLKDFEGKRIYDVHQMSSVDCDLESRKNGFFLLCETEFQTDIFEMDAEVEGQDNITILGFIFKENIIIDKSLQSKYEDFSTPFIALKNVMIQNAYFCGDSHYIGGDFICQIVYSHYNFGELIVKGNAKILIIKSTNMKMYFANLTSANAIINDSKKDIYVQIDIENEDGNITKEIAIHPPTHNLEDVFLENYFYLDEYNDYLVNDETFFEAFRNGEKLIDESKFLNKYYNFNITFSDRMQRLFETETLKNLVIDEIFYEDIIEDSQYYFFVKKDNYLQMGFWNTIYNYSMYINYFETGETQFITQHYESDNETPKLGFTTTLNDNFLNTFAVKKMFCEAEMLMLNKYNQ